ncbi:MAG: DUF1491 family protein [Erythrobacter sp.]|uniref:DUF1491 family protein n=1 Tax=Erythrobacter sp. HL-111 TaxID=1798193 RepID=UPI0006DBC5F3|nr:DUF1491 family protein [Erythrobacter sp. HL-111]KPP90661.1 MAG: hypothetical protein HLUCCO15_09070 [Erythrobacteraceae bacterium HL-111]SDS76242.1 hypothetical protein SAMN04515621_2182 [Erythrobacter sp. HL-111]
MSGRLPAHVEVGAILRMAEAGGGMATVLAKGERDAGTVLVVIMRRGENARLHERMPGLDFERRWTLTRTQDAQDKQAFADYLERRRRQDPDTWIVEIDVDDPEKFAALLPQ